MSNETERPLRGAMNAAAPASGEGSPPSPAPADERPCDRVPDRK